jgi:hypothetical protein
VSPLALLAAAAILLAGAAVIIGGGIAFALWLALRVDDAMGDAS